MAQGLAGPDADARPVVRNLLAEKLRFKLMT
jgi:hypothetical protein